MGNYQEGQKYEIAAPKLQLYQLPRHYHAEGFACVWIIIRRRKVTRVKDDKGEHLSCKFGLIGFVVLCFCVNFGYLDKRLKKFT